MTVTEQVSVKQDLKYTVKAVLARFDGDRHEAMRYCMQMMSYSHLRDEYVAIGNLIRLNAATAAAAGRA